MVVLWYIAGSYTEFTVIKQPGRNAWKAGFEECGEGMTCGTNHPAMMPLDVLAKRCVATCH